MRKVDNLLMCLMCLLTVSLTVSAQEKAGEYYVSRILTVSDGLPNVNINDIFQDDKGFMWISTFGGGIARYDGSSFVTLSTKGNEKILSDYVTRSCADGYGRLWVSSVSGVDVIDMNTLTHAEIPADLKAAAHAGYCGSVVRDSEGGMWFNTRNYIYRVSFRDEGRTYVLDSLRCSDTNMNLRLPIFPLEGEAAVCTTMSGRLYTVSAPDGGGIRLDVEYPELFIGENNKGTAICSTDNELWLGTQNGLFRFNKVRRTVVQYRTIEYEPLALSHNEVTGLAVSPDGDILVGTLAGLNVYKRDLHGFIHYNSEPDIYGGKDLPGDMIRCMKVVGHQIWLGLEVDGLSVMRKKSLPFTMVSHRENDLHSLPSTPVRSVYVDSRGNEWVGTTEHGLFLNTGNYTYRYFTSNNSAIQHNTITAFTEDANGHLWFGTAGGQVNYVDMDRPTKVYVPRDSDSELALSIDVINMIVYDPVNDFVWISSRSGLYLYDIAKSKYRKFEDVYLCMGACADDAGRLWVSHRDGLLAINLHSLESTYDPLVPLASALVSDETGDIWAGLFDGGLLKLHHDSRNQYSMQFYTEEDGLAHNRVRGLLIDGDVMWVTTENGLSRMNMETGEIRTFNSSDGLRSADFCENSISMNSAGNIFLGTKDGLCVLQSSEVSDAAYDAPSVSITGGISAVGQVNLAYEDGMFIKEGDREFSFIFSDFGFPDESAVRYSCRIYPLDKEWRPLYGPNRTIRYGGLPGGSYRIQVRATDEAGNELSMDERELHVKPFFYKTWWFACICLLLLAGAIYLIVKERTHKLERNRQILQEEVKRQTKLLSAQKAELQQKADELAEQNMLLRQQIEELAAHRLVQSTDPSNKSTQFIDNVMAVVRKLYKEPDLDITRFSEEMGMSRSVLNEKLNEAIGQSIGQFIRSYRLSVAKEIITKGPLGDMNVSEIAYEVGFNDPKYFTRCFSKEFGVSPSAMMAKK